jgi:hypothetical protein
MNDIINNSYVVGIGGRNLVLNTLGRVWVKVKDRYYEWNFKDQEIASLGESNSSSEVIILTSKGEVLSLPYPGDNFIIISLDGGL